MTDPTTWSLDKLIRLIDAADSLLREGSTGPACQTLGELQERRNVMIAEFRTRCDRGEVPKHLSCCDMRTYHARMGANDEDREYVEHRDGLSSGGR